MSSDPTKDAAEHSHRMHLHYNVAMGHGEKPEQFCIATYELKPGSQVSMHMHSGECVRCSGGHCHEPNVTLVMTEQWELMLTFENFQPPLYVEGNDRGDPPRNITNELPKTVTDDGEIEYGGDNF